MLDPSWLWALFTIIAAAAQTVRNATQRELTAKLGTVGATHVRFLFGFPFALAAVAFRGAILHLGGSSYVMAATLTVVVGLMLQSVLLSLYLRMREPEVFVVIVRAWRPSLFAGFMGALASQFWFLAFALATAASVRTLALVEVLFAQAISRLAFRQRTSLQEGAGIVLIVIGVTLVLWAQ